VPEVLARLTTQPLDAPRGPDVAHRIRVPQAWLESGALIEFELPRTLACAACDGGGCDLCQRAGAVTLRGREELPELLQVTLPARLPEPNAGARSVVIRIPERGGLPAEHEPLLPRGLLLLRVDLAESADPGLTRILAKPEPARRVWLSRRPLSPSTKQALIFALVLVLAALARLAFLAFQRHRGLG
jgi:hypothetical protein